MSKIVTTVYISKLQETMSSIHQENTISPLIIHTHTHRNQEAHEKKANSERVLN